MCVCFMCKRQAMNEGDSWSLSLPVCMCNSVVSCESKRDKDIQKMFGRIFAQRVDEI